MYKTSISVRMLVMSIIFALGFLVFAVITVSNTLEIYTENQILRRSLAHKEEILKKYSERAEVLSQYRQLENELKKITEISTTQVAYARNVISPPATAKAPEPAEPTPSEPGPEPLEENDWDPESDTGAGSADEEREAIEDDQNTDSSVQVAAIQPEQETTPPPEEKEKTEKDAAPEPEEKEKEVVAEKTVQPTEPTAQDQPEPEPIQQAQSGQLVDARNLSLTMESNNTVNFQYKLANTHPDNKPVAGYLFIILANPYTNPPLFAPFPAVPLVGGFPADYRKGAQFSIKRGKTVRGRLPGLIDPGHYNQAWIFAYSKDGELLLKKHLISDNG